MYEHHWLRKMIVSPLSKQANVDYCFLIYSFDILFFVHFAFDILMSLYFDFRKFLFSSYVTYNPRVQQICLPISRTWDVEWISIISRIVEEDSLYKSMYLLCVKLYVKICSECTKTNIHFKLKEGWLFFDRN